MNKIVFCLCILFLCFSFCNAGQVFYDFTVSTDLVVGYALVGGGTYLLFVANPVGQAIGAVAIIGGLHFIWNYIN